MNDLDTAAREQEREARRRGARRRFETMVTRRDVEPDVAEAALWIAAEAQPGLDVEASLRELDRLAARARPAVEAALGERERVEALCRVLFEEEGFRGDREDYGDPRNSYLDQVLSRRLGLPITLAIVFVEVAQRLGLHAVGVGFPGHFLAKVVGREELLVDAFEGELVGEARCRELLEAIHSHRSEFDRDLLRAARPREILARILTNLKHSHLERDDPEQALACCDRLLLLAPGAALEIRDRGLLYRRLDCFRAALADLERFLELAPQHESAGAVRQSLAALRAQVRRLH